MDLFDPAIPVLGPNVSRAHGRLASAVGRLMMGLRGWRVEGTIPDIPRMVLIVAPHTSNWDFLTGLWVKLAMRLGARFVGKHTLFRFPLGVFMRWLGGVPVDRSAAAGFASEAARALREAERMTLVIAPEGTRRRAEKWKSGFYRIAVEAGVPIVPAGFDYSRRVVFFAPPLVPTGDYERDLTDLRRLYRPDMALRPENYGS
jgi:1-acyl-sn-glycerol-3-phosphate acyltransferase